jgi:hypothetical protein
MKYEEAIEPFQLWHLLEREAPVGWPFIKG